MKASFAIMLYFSYVYLISTAVLHAKKGKTARFHKCNGHFALLVISVLLTNSLVYKLAGMDNLSDFFASIHVVYSSVLALIGYHLLKFADRKFNGPLLSDLNENENEL